MSATALKPDVRGFFDPATATWTYVVWSDESQDRRCAIIDSVLDYDPASARTSTTSADKVIRFVEQKKLKPEWIIETHIHADHLTAAHYLKQKLGGKTAISHHIVDVLKTWLPIFATANDTPADGSQFDHLFDDSEEFTIGALKTKIMHTPGHTPADTSFVVGDAVFVGDAMFLPDVGSGRCDFPGGNAGDSFDSAQKLLALPSDYRMYVGHDYPGPNRNSLCMTTIGEQKAANLRFHEGATRARFVEERNKADAGKPVPELLLPAVQVNLRGGGFGADIGGTRYVRLPVDRI
jgi:glyoxylase-like metal-dependent hydrolase (beta-lactamase superfamily II)